MHASRRQLVAAALTAPLFVRHATAADVARFEIGVASGQPRADRLVLWTRLTGVDLPDRCSVQWELARDEAFADIAAQGSELALVEDAHSVHAEPLDLEPARWFWYRFTALGQRSAVGRTRTAPAAQAPATLAFAITSCQRWDQGHWAAWRELAREPLDLVMFLGDYIYEYPSPASSPRHHDGGLVRNLQQYRNRYAQYKSDPSLQAAHAAFPWLIIWDDHEVANDYAQLQGESPGSDFASQRAAAYKAWWEHMPVSHAMRPIGPDARIFGRWDWGRLARIHTLDDRQYRDLQACPPFARMGSNHVQRFDCAALDDPRRSLLGAAQERWLAEGWDLERPWNLLAQQTLMARLSGMPVDGPSRGQFWTDGWDGYAPARQRLLTTAVDRGVRNLVVLGGDVHAHFVADLKTDFDDLKGPVVGSEFCGTSISSRGPSTSRIANALPWNPHIHYGRPDRRGYVAFDLDEQRLQARLMAVRDVMDPGSRLEMAARFVVLAGRPGPQPA